MTLQVKYGREYGIYNKKVFEFYIYELYIKCVNIPY